MRYSLIIFDLDFTLWNAGGTWCDHTSPPYRKVNDHIKDSENNIIFLYPEAKEILEDLSVDYTLGIASRTHRPEWALELMSLFNIKHLFKYFEIYPGSKVEHFYQIQSRSGIAFSQMLFFDDEMRNIDDVRNLDATTVLVDQGITRELVSRHIS